MYTWTRASRPSASTPALIQGIFNRNAAWFTAIRVRRESTTANSTWERSHPSGRSSKGCSKARIRRSRLIWRERRPCTCAFDLPTSGV